MQIKLENVGRNKFCGIIKHDGPSNPKAIAKAAFNEARKHLLSRDVECVYHSDTNEGFIFAGFRTVGVFSVLPAEQPQFAITA